MLPHPDCRRPWRALILTVKREKKPHDRREQISRRARALAERPGRFLGRAGRRDRLDEALGQGARRRQSALLSLVPRRRTQCLPQCARPACRRWPRRAGGADLRLAAHQHQEDLHLSRAARSGRAHRRHDRGPGRGQGRPCHPLHADDPRSRYGDARLRSDRCHPFRGVRRLRGQGTVEPHRRLRAQADPDRLVRHRADAHRAVQAAGRSGDRAGGSQGAEGYPAAAAAVCRDDGGRSRPRLGRGAGHGPARAVRAGQGDGPALHPLHVGHDRAAQGRRARHRRLLRGARLVDEEPLRRRAG